MKPGWKSSELYVIAIAFLYYVAKSMGWLTPEVETAVIETHGSAKALVEAVAGQVQNISKVQASLGGETPLYVAGLYAGLRAWLKKSDGVTTEQLKAIVQEVIDANKEE